MFVSCSELVLTRRRMNVLLALFRDGCSYESPKSVETKENRTRSCQEVIEIRMEKGQ